MKNHFFQILLFIYLPFLATAQIQLERQVIASSGGYASDGGISVSWTLGESAIETLESTNADIYLTQGFQQPDSMDMVDAVRETVEELGLTIYPNPVGQTLKIRLDEMPPHSFEVRLTDLSGRRVLQQKTMDTATLEIYMGDLPNALYLLTFSDGESLISRKVLKAGNR